MVMEVKDASIYRSVSGTLSAQNEYMSTLDSAQRDEMGTTYLSGQNSTRIFRDSTRIVQYRRGSVWKKGTLDRQESNRPRNQPSGRRD